MRLFKMANFQTEYFSDRGPLSNICWLSRSNHKEFTKEYVILDGETCFRKNIVHFYTYKQFYFKQFSLA